MSVNPSKNRAMPEQNVLSIVIVNWNCGDLLRQGIQTLVNSQPKVTYEILVIDNHSSDESVELLINADFVAPLLRDNKLRIIRNFENVGFGPANNQAFRMTRSPLVMLLNPDTEVSSGAIDTLVASLKSSSRIGAVGPRILNTDGSVQTSVWHNPPRAWQTILSQLKLYLLIPAHRRGELLLGGHWLHDRRRLVPMLSGAAIMVRRELLDEVGGFDESFKMYAEDNEWCFRIGQAGWQMLFEPDAIVLHHSGQSAKKRWTNLEKIRIKAEAWYLYERKSLRRWPLIKNRSAELLIASAQKLWRDIRGVDASEVALARQLHWKHLKQSLKGDHTSLHSQNQKANADTKA